MQGVSIRAYKGMYFVEYNTKSVGMTLLATWDKKQADSEYNKIRNMSERARRQYILAK